MLMGHLEQTPTSRPVEYQPMAVRSLLRPSAAGGPWHWTLNPYKGCELGCAFCPVRIDQRDPGGWLDFERRVGVKTNLVEAFLRDLKADTFENRPLVLGSDSEPWQPAEEHFRVTRALLTAIAGVDGLDLRIHTRASLIARDTDLLVKVAQRNRLTVSFSLCSMDDRINRLIEPKAPSAMRRLAAMEALSRAGLEVGVLVAPFLSGLDERELGLQALLTRAANAGAHFAGLGFLDLAPAQRENLLAMVAAGNPGSGTRLRRVLGRRPFDAEEKAERWETFRGLCGRLGLQAVQQGGAPQGEDHSGPPTQMALFS
jgi:DNA repair photolyase